MTPVAVISKRAADAVCLAANGQAAKAATIALAVCRTDVLELVQHLRHRDVIIARQERENAALRAQVAQGDTSRFAAGDNRG